MRVEFFGTKAQTISGFGYRDNLIIMVIAHLVEGWLLIDRLVVKWVFMRPLAETEPQIAVCGGKVLKSFMIKRKIPPGCKV